MTKIYIARHGQDEDNANGILNGHRDKALTELGIKQANELAKNILKLNIKINKIFCSPLRRAHQTAKIVADFLHLQEPEKLDILIERNFGDMTGKKVKDIEKLCAPDIIKSEKITYFLSRPEAEDFPDLKKRGAQVIEFLRQNNFTDDTLLVCHGDIGKMIYCAFYDLDWKQVLIDTLFGNSDIILLSDGINPENSFIYKSKQFNA